MADYKTPGVYVEEISTLPSSIAQVPTAIPGFVGFTAKTEYNGKSLLNKPQKVDSLLEFHELFGGVPTNRMIEVTLNADNQPTSVQVSTPVGATPTSGNTFYLYDAVRLFFQNGGGQCYVVSTGNSDDSANIALAPLQTGLAALEKVDEPTLLVIPDAVNLTAAELGTLQQQMLMQCADLQDRFAVLDVKETHSAAGTLGTLDSNVQAFRDNIGIDNLKYGGTYTPYIHVFPAVSPQLSDIFFNGGSLAPFDSDPTVVAIRAAVSDQTTLKGAGNNTSGTPWATAYATVLATAVGTTAELQHYLTVSSELAVRIGELINPAGGSLTVENVQIGEKVASEIRAGGPVANALSALAGYAGGYPTSLGSIALTGGIFDGTNPHGNVPDYNLGSVTADNSIYPAGASEGDTVRAARSAFRREFNALLDALSAIRNTAGQVIDILEGVLRSNSAFYANVIKAVNEEGLRMPPSGAVLGRYALTDSTQGVWKAPANTSLAGVFGLTENITDKDQAPLNVDVNSGKSVNAIREFRGKGFLIWGARTLAGNDNEWRYVPVRRTFIMAEESIQKATEAVVFEPNDANTWNKLNGMISNFLTGLWRDGALAGAKPEEAFFVKVGLGVTMTQLDILEGRLIVEIGLAVVRPAEFIILRFMHKLQES